MEKFDEHKKDDAKIIAELRKRLTELQERCEETKTEYQECKNKIEILKNLKRSHTDKWFEEELCSVKSNCRNC